MSGVNCTRRKSTPTARANAFGEQRLGDAGHAFEQEVAADGRRGEQHLDDVVLADDDLAHLAHDAVSQFVHCKVLSSVTRATTRPSASTSSVFAGGCHSATISSSVRPIVARRVSIVASFRVGGQPGAPV